MRIAIVGSGALGGLYGAYLARDGADVHFLMRSDYDAVRANGLTIKSYKGDFHLESPRCYKQAEAIGPVDLVLVGLKTTANEHYEELIGPLMGEETRVLTAQNGLGNEEALAGLFGDEHIAGGLAFLCSNRTEPGVIEHLDYGHIHIGNYKRKPDEVLNAFGAMLNDSGVECVVVDDLAVARWKKLVWNVPFNGLTALLDKTVDFIIKDGFLKYRAERLMKEVQGVAKVLGHEIEDEFLVKMMESSEKMKPYYTSMHLDRIHGRPMEVDSILGEPLRRGRQQGMHLPEMEFLFHELSKIDRENRKSDK